MGVRCVVVAIAATAACGRIDFQTSPDGMPHDTGDGNLGDGAQPCSALHELCEDFASATLNTAVWTASGDVSIDTTFGHSGNTSLLAQTPQYTAHNGGQAQINETETLALGDPTFYVRVWVYLSAQPVDNMQVVTAEQTNGGGDQEDGFFVDAGNVSVYAQFGAMGNQNSTTPAPVGSWFCALWTVARAAQTTGSEQLGGDVGPLSLDNVQTDGSPTISIMTFGIGFANDTDSSAQPAMSLWIDDIIIDKAPLTCDESAS